MIAFQPRRFGVIVNQPQVKPAVDPTLTENRQKIPYFLAFFQKYLILLCLKILLNLYEIVISSHCVDFT